jgi:DMSO/TMAO reductase YedYZ heme-binding membrane subunit
MGWRSRLNRNQKNAGKKQDTWPLLAIFCRVFYIFLGITLNLGAIEMSNKDIANLFVYILIGFVGMVLIIFSFISSDETIIKYGPSP